MPGLHENYGNGPRAPLGCPVNGGNSPPRSTGGEGVQYHDTLTRGAEIITEPTLTPEQSAERSLQLALAAARTASENRGYDIVLLDMREITPIFDYFLVVTGSSRRQLHAISEEIDHTLEDELGDQRMGIEGYNESHWILLDYGTVVIHLFDQETREYYALEDFWNAAARVPLPGLEGLQIESPTEDGPQNEGGLGLAGEPAADAKPVVDEEPGMETA